MDIGYGYPIYWSGSGTTAWLGSIKRVLRDSIDIVMIGETS